MQFIYFVFIASFLLQKINCITRKKSLVDNNWEDGSCSVQDIFLPQESCNVVTANIKEMNNEQEKKLKDINKLIEKAFINIGVLNNEIKGKDFENFLVENLHTLGPIDIITAIEIAVMKNLSAKYEEFSHLISQKLTEFSHHIGKFINMESGNFKTTKPKAVANVGQLASGPDRSESSEANLENMLEEFDKMLEETEKIINESLDRLIL